MTLKATALITTDYNTVHAIRQTRLRPYLFRLTLRTLGGTINTDGEDTRDDAAPSCPSCVSLFLPVVQALGAPSHGGGAQLLAFPILESEQFGGKPVCQHSV